MREKFIDWFKINYPGTPLTGPTEASEFSTWSAGYCAALDHAIEVIKRNQQNAELEGWWERQTSNKEATCD